jgi:hypothetical protein
MTLTWKKRRVAKGYCAIWNLRTKRPWIGKYSLERARATASEIEVRQRDCSIADS